MSSKSPLRQPLGFRPSSEPVDEPRTDRNLAFAALLLLLTAFWLPFWVIRLDDGAGVTTSAFRMFQPYDPVTTSWAPHLTGAVLVITGLVLFVRLAGRSWYHEPAVWIGSLWAGMGALIVAAATVMFWPASIPLAIGRRTLRDEGGAVVATETAMPGLAWWLVVGAAACLAVAAWWSRQQIRAAEGAETDTQGDTTGK